MIGFVILIALIVLIVILCIVMSVGYKKEYKSMLAGDTYYPYGQKNPFKMKKAIILNKKDGYVLFSFQGEEYSMKYDSFLMFFEKKE